MLVKTISLHVKSSSSTLTPIDVPAHERAILENIHGEENMYDQPSSGELVELDVKTEYQRLCSKYSDQVVGEIFGGQGSAALKQAMAEHEAEAQKPLKADAKAKADPKADAKAE